MIWFKHDTNAVNDAKVKKLVIRYGAEGYAIYFHCIELIAGDINENNITFCLEHDSEIIADNLKIKGTAEKSGIQIVEEIMNYIIELNLFETHNNLIYCYKLLKRLDLSMTSSQKFRQVIADAKENHDIVMTESCKIRRDKIRLNNKRIDNIKTDDKEKEDSFNIFWEIYNKKKNKEKSFQIWCKIDPELYQVIYNHVKIYRKTKEGKDFPYHPNNYLKDKHWNDEIETEETIEERKEKERIIREREMEERLTGAIR